VDDEFNVNTELLCVEAVKGTKPGED